MKLRFVAVTTLAALMAGATAFGASPAPRGQTGPRLSLRELVNGWSRATPPMPPGTALTAPSSSRGDLLAALSGGHGLDSRCPTPLLIALHQNGPTLNQPTRRLFENLTRVSGPPSSTKMSPGAEFRIHYRTDSGSADRVDPYDGDLNGTPDGVDRLAAELTEQLADFVHALSWAPRPAPGGDTVVDVHLIGQLTPAGGVGGFVMPRGTASIAGAPLEELRESPEGAESVLFLDSSLASAKAVSRDAVAHMVAHMVLMRESARESPWWHEASATWLESRLERNAATIAGTFALPGRAARGLSDDTPGLSLEAFLWPHYLVQSTGSDTTMLRRMWEEMAAVPGNNTFDAMDRVLRRHAGSSLAEEIRIFNIWNLFTGKADDGGHYPFASLLPTPPGDATFETFPARGAAPVGPIAPLGAALLRVLGDGSQGGLRIRFFGEEPGDWDVSLIVYSAVRGGARHVPIELDASGRGFIPVPWRSLTEVDLLIQNLASPSTTPAEYFFAIDYDPTVPFDLLGFTAEDSSPGATLAWSTDGEERLAGWNIWRGTGPVGPFSRINQYLVPAAGLAGRTMSYVYVDGSAGAGRKYYYHLEAVTLDGFTERSHPAGVRLGGAAARRSPR